MVSGKQRLGTKKVNCNISVCGTAPLGEMRDTMVLVSSLHGTVYKSCALQK